MSWLEILSVVVSVLSLLGFGTVMKLYWEDRHRRKLEESEETKRKRKQEHHKEIVDAVSEILDPYKEKILEYIDVFDKRLDLAQKCNQAELRNSLMNIYYACDQKGYRTEDDSKNYREMHEAYNAVGGNSFIDNDVSKWFNDLPLRANDYPLKHKQQKQNESKNNTKSGNRKSNIRKEVRSDEQ